MFPPPRVGRSILPKSLTLVAFRFPNPRSTAERGLGGAGEVASACRREVEEWMDLTPRMDRMGRIRKDIVREV
jgi:hypothetical protein